MSIDCTQRLQPVSSVQPHETPADNRLQPRKSTTAKTTFSGNQLKLSHAQAHLMLPGTQDIDISQVAAIKQAIQRGELKMDTGKIADALLQNVQSDMLWWNPGR